MFLLFKLIISLLIIYLILLKKALYLIKIADVQNGNNLLKSLIDRETILKNIAQDLLQNR